MTGSTATLCAGSTMPLSSRVSRSRFSVMRVRRSVSCSPDAPLVLELGCGKGEYTVALAQRRPESVFVGVDIKGARLWKGAKFVETNHISNAAFLRARIEFISAFFAPGEVSEIWLTFSDPQYKSPNSRLSSPVFLDRYRKMLCKGGIVHLKTDSSDFLILGFWLV